MTIPKGSLSANAFVIYLDASSQLPLAVSLYAPQSLWHLYGSKWPALANHSIAIFGLKCFDIYKYESGHQSLRSVRYLYYYEITTTRRLLCKLFNSRFCGITFFFTYQPLKLQNLCAIWPRVTRSLTQLLSVHLLLLSHKQTRCSVQRKTSQDAWKSTMHSPLYIPDHLKNRFCSKYFLASEILRSLYGGKLVNSDKYLNKFLKTPINRK